MLSGVLSLLNINFVCAFSGSEVLQHRDTETLSRLFHSMYKTVHARQFEVLQNYCWKVVQYRS